MWIPVRPCKISADAHGAGAPTPHSPVAIGWDVNNEKICSYFQALARKKGWGFFMRTKRPWPCWDTARAFSLVRTLIHARARNLGSGADRKAPSICDVGPDAFPYLYRIAHSEPSVHKSNNSTPICGAPRKVGVSFWSKRYLCPRLRRVSWDGYLRRHAWSIAKSNSLFLGRGRHCSRGCVRPFHHPLGKPMNLRCRIYLQDRHFITLVPAAAHNQKRRQTDRIAIQQAPARKRKRWSEMCAGTISLLFPYCLASSHCRSGSPNFSRVHPDMLRTNGCKSPNCSSQGCRKPGAAFHGVLRLKWPASIVIGTSPGSNSLPPHSWDLESRIAACRHRSNHAGLSLGNRNLGEPERQARSNCPLRTTGYWKCVLMGETTAETGPNRRSSEESE